MPSLDFKHERSEFRRFYRVDGEILRSALSSFKGLVRALLSGRSEFPAPVVTGRLKDCEEAIAKFERKYRTELEDNGTDYAIKDYITDLLGVRVICYYESDVPKIQTLLTSNFQVLGVTDKNKELANDPASFGYKGVHLDLKLNGQRSCLPEFSAIKDFSFELQLRTTVQHSWSEIEHKISYKKSVPNSLRRRIVRLAGLFELADQEFEAIKNETASLKAEAEQDPLEDTKDDVFDQPLSSFECGAVMEVLYDDYRENPEYVDGFVAELLRIDPSLTVKRFIDIINENRRLTEDYAKYLLENRAQVMNPFTRMRHLIYASNPDKYGILLFPKVRKVFDEWRSQENQEANEPLHPPAGNAPV